MVKEVNMDTSSTIKRLLGECENIRTENQREGQRREREIRQGFPAIAALLDERRDRLTGSIRTALQGRTVDAENLQGEMRELNGRIRAELTKAGYPEYIICSPSTAARSAGIPGMSANRYMSFAPA